MICSVPDCGRPQQTLQLCVTHYRRGVNHVIRPMVEPGVPLRFAMETAQLPIADHCVMWPYSTSMGYPEVQSNKRKRKVSHVVLEARGHTRPSSEHNALHSCDTPLCIAWWHLRWGTQLENMNDAYERGRKW